MNFTKRNKSWEIPQAWKQDLRSPRGCTIS